MYTKIYLKARKEEAVLRFHPWVFSGAIARMEGEATDGDIVEVYSKRGDFLAVGHYHNGSIAVRILSFEQKQITKDFWKERLTEAINMRKALGLWENAETNAYRLLHGEGDGMSGLILDVYGDVAVFQAHSIGMHKARVDIAAALKELYGDKLIAIYDKSSASLPKHYAAGIEDNYLYGEVEGNSAVVLENGCKFAINWETGQKTGFFLDQRNNRKLIQQYSKDKKVLNAFCYSGGFSIYALEAGAKTVHSVDASAKAIALLDKNIEVNNMQEQDHEGIVEDVLRFLKNTSNEYDVMVLDPPAYAKSIKKRHRAVQGYKRLNVEGFKHIKKGGILFTFSCSQVVDNKLFYSTIMAAAIEAKRKVKVLHRLTQPADHPVNMFHPEGNYLKGLVLYVD